MSNISVIYDGDCPFCRRYVSWVRFREAIGPVELINAREHPDLVKEMNDLGYDLDTGMILRIDDAIYHGDECLHRIALMTTRNTFFNTLTGTLFKSKTLSKISYPVLRAGRNGVLRLMGRKKINPENET